MDEMDEMWEYHRNLEDKGYIAHDGTPLKCQMCEGTSFVSEEEHYESIGLVEYSLRCASCGEFAGHWAYGSWSLI